MPDATEKRKLAAIMFTDMVGYSALSQRDAKLAVELLEEHRQILRGIFPRFDGTEIKTIGDAFLVEFTSALEAAQCAIEIQRALAHRDADEPAERQIQVRIGIHIGDVIHRGDDVYGDGVNIASRIEPLANPGGICLSMDVERQIRNAVETHFEKLAPTELKNISVPMDLFRIVLPWERPAVAGKPEIRSEPDGRFPKPETESRKSAGIPWHEIVIGIMLLAALIGGAMLWFHRAGSGRNTASGNSVAATQSVPEKSIAVLPFQSLSKDEENAYFADGVQDQILTHLAKIADLKVISRTSVMQYKTGAQRNLREIGQQLGVAHLLEGSVQRAANKVRVNAQLIDARSDAHQWAENYDRDLADVFAIQSEIAKAIADQLRAKLSPNEKSAIEERPTDNIAAFNLYSRGKTLLLTPGSGAGVDDKLREGVELIKKATVLDSAFHVAFCEFVLGSDRLYNGGIDRTPERRSAAESALRTAEKLKPDSPETHLARASHLYRVLRDYEGAQTQLEIAARGLPNDARIPALKGYMIRRQGKWEEALPLLKQALTLDPRNFALLTDIAATHSALRQYAEVASAFDRALQIKPDDLNFRQFRAQNDWSWRADPAPICQVVEQVRLNTPGSLPDVADTLFICALSKRDWAAAEQALAVLGDNTFWPDLNLNRQFGEGLLARAMHDDARARQAFAAARVEQEQLVQKQKDYGPPLCVLGLIDAALGNKEAALREGRRAMEVSPREKDALNGDMLIGYFAVIAAWAGEKDLAIEQLNAALPLPGATQITSYGVLKLMPFWDPLRGDPRFEAIVQKLAPKS
jgi:adenylate cyclase